MKSSLNRSHFKQILQEALPPVIFRSIIWLIKNLTRATQQKNISSYENLDLVLSVVEKNKIYRNFLALNEFDLPAVGTILGLSLAQISTSATVVDFGGGGGNHYTIAKKLFPDIKFDWIIVETAEMARHANESLGNSEVCWVDSISNVRPKLQAIDLVFSSSALQYTDNPIAKLRELTNIKAKNLFITRTVLAMEVIEPEFVLQESKLSSNGPGRQDPNSNKLVKYPITLCSVNDFKKEILELYEIVFTIKEGGVPRLNTSSRTESFTFFCQLRDQ